MGNKKFVFSLMYAGMLFAWLNDFASRAETKPSAGVLGKKEALLPSQSDLQKYEDLSSRLKLNDGALDFSKQMVKNLSHLPDSQATLRKKPEKTPVRKKNEAFQKIYTLTDALEAAYYFNPILEKARVDTILAAEEKARALTDWRPNIYINASQSATKNRNHALVYDPIINSLKTPKHEKGKAFNSDGSASINLQQNLYSGGRTLAQVARADASFSASLFKLISQEQRIFQEVISAFCDVVLAQEIVELQKKSEIYIKEISEQTKVRFEIGEQTMADVASAKARLAAALADTSRAKADLAARRASLEAMIQVPLSEDLVTPEAVEKLPKTVKELEQEAFKYNPDLLTASQGVKAAQFEVAVVNSKFLPDLNLTSSAGLERRFSKARAQPQIFDRRNNIINRNLNVALQLRVPIYSQGATHVEFRAAEQRVKQARLEMEGVCRQLRAGCEARFAELMAFQDSLASSEIAVNANTLSLDAMRTEYALGLQDFSNVNKAEEQWNGSYKGYLETANRLVKISYQILELTGKLTAQNLKLAVNIYDPLAYYKKYADSWWSLGDAADDGPLFRGPQTPKTK
jgi:outer membrane protein